MKVASIQSCNSHVKICKKSYAKAIHNQTTVETNANELTFNGKKAIKGIGIGAGLGILTATLLSGGAAAPIILGIYAGTSGLVGGMVGKAMDENESQENKKEK